jgi:multiple sugar transport system ATP-binding protein
MHQGEVQQFDEPETIYNRPANMFVAGFMGSPSMNFISAEISPSADGGKPSVKYPARGSRQCATLPLHNRAAGPEAPNRKVVLGIRPEHLSRYRARIHASKPGIATMSRRSRWSSRPAPRPWPS